MCLGTMMLLSVVTKHIGQLDADMIFTSALKSTSFYHLILTCMRKKLLVLISWF